MSLSDRFQLFGLKRDDGVRTFEAKEIATGRPVLVHFLPANNPLLRRLDGLSEQERSRVIDRGEEAGNVHLVTDRLMDFAGFREWVSQDGPKPLSAGGAWQVTPPTIPGAPKPLNVDSQFEDLFGKAPPIPAPTLGPTPVLSNTAEITLQMPAMQEAPPPLAPAPTPPPIVIKDVVKENEPGEFTRQFAPVLRPMPTPKPELVPRPAPPPSNEPGEFTRQFAQPVLRPTPNPPPPTFAPPASTLISPSSNEPGEFTQMLQAQRPTQAPAPSMSSSQETEFAKYFQSPMTPAPNATPITPPPPPKRAFQAGNAGEFTQVFGRADIPAPPPVLRPSPPPIQSVPETTQAFEKPRTPPPMFAPPPPPVSKGPGEYTRQFSAPAPLTFGQAPATPQVPRMQLNVPTVKRKSLLPLFLMLGGGFLLLLAVIVYLVMRSRG